MSRPTPSVSPTLTQNQAEEGNLQSLVAAFAFGIVVNAASGAAFYLIRGHGSTLFKDGLRLVLVTFLVAAALWAQVDFIATIIDPAPSTRAGCQIAIAVASAFDQISRVALLQYLLWAVNSGTKMSVESFVPQGLLLIRFVVGAVFVGMQRPQFNPTCVATTQILPVAIVTIALDVVLFLTTFGRAVSSGVLREMKEPTPNASRAKGIFFTMLGFAVWTGASVPMIIGIADIELILRTAVPAAALVLLIGIVSSFSGAMVISKERARSYPPEAPSPRRIDTTRDLQSRDLSTSDSDYPPSRYEDLKGGEIMSVMTFAAPREAPMPQMPPQESGVSQNMGGMPMNMQASAFQTAGFGGAAVQGQLFPPTKANTAPPLREVNRANSVRPKKNGGKIEISGPILSESGDQNPLNKIATIDLATAAANERERRDQAWRDMSLQRDSSLIAKRPAPQPPAMSPEEAMKRSQSVKRKEIASGGLSPGNPLRSQNPGAEQEPMPVPVSTATTTSAQLSPGVEEIRRRSPRQPQPPQAFQEQSQNSPRKSPPVRPPRPDEPRSPKTPKTPRSPRTPAVPPTPNTPVQQEMKIEDKRTPPQRPPRPESLDIDIEPQVTKAAPRQLVGVNPQVKNAQRAATPPRKSEKTAVMSPVKEEAPTFAIKAIETAAAAAPIPAVAPVPAPQPPRALSPPRAPQANSPPRVQNATVPQPQAPPVPQQPQAMASNARMSQFPVPPTGGPRQAQFPLPQNPRGVSPPRAAVSKPTPPPEPQQEEQPVDGRMSILPRNGSVRVNIRPSRQRPPSLEDKPEPEKPMVQRRPTAGLPGNPRAMSKMIAAEAGAAREQTVMFVNNIQYNDPVGVQNIIQGAVNKAAQNAEKAPPAPPAPPAPAAPADAKSPGEGLKSGNSVLHRPRPIPRKSDKDRGAFPSEPSPSPKNTHQRNRSGGSISSRKSILRSQPGSPTQLPPLPPPPKSAGNPLRPLPNDTKSMTFDEKMAIFFPAPPSGSSTTSGSNRTNKRNSPVPEMPSLPAAFLDMDDESESGSRRSTKTSVRTQSVLEIDEIPRPPVGRNTSKFSTDSYVVDEVGRSWLPGIPPSEPSMPRPSYDGAKRMSSPVLPRGGDVMSEISDVRTHDEEATNWGSVHSPVRAVNMQARQVPKPTYIPRQGSGDGKEVMTIMLDDSVGFGHDERESWLADGEAMMNMPSSFYGDKRGSEWHRRVGDNCPTFSDRQQKARSRKMVPPTPLLLRTKSNKNTTVIRPAEPSPLESPSAAYQDIQKQLNKLDQPKETNRDSMNSEGRRMTLLQNLEKEMNMQEDHWHEMQQDIRDSMSTIKTSPRRDSIPEMPTRVPSKDKMANIAADRRARKQRSRGDSISKEAHLEYMENHGRLVANASRAKLNVVPVSKLQLGSPTPPDTDESDDDGMDMRLVGRKNMAANPKRDSFDGKLWNKPSPVTEVPTPSTGLLWTPGATASPRLSLPGTNVRPQQRKSSVAAKRNSIEEPAEIQSSTLWTKSEGAKKSRAAGGLWKAAPPPAQKEKEKDQKPARPLTQRPPRRSRRVTLLPDIVESPEPLPDNRGTLGIFQFPWGERSDMATVNTRPGTMFMAMPGTMTTGGPAITAALEARSKQLEAQEYSSSFFDDYDEESDMSDVDGTDSDDGFDETTLWEIASLLQTDQVPSKGSLLPGTRIKFAGENSIVDDYIMELPSDEEDSDEERNEDITIQLDTGAFPLPPRQSSLWAGRAKSPVQGANGGLPQPDERTWEKYMPSAGGAPRPAVRKEQEPAKIQSTSLWTMASRRDSHREPALLWSPKTQRSMTMWAAPEKMDHTEPFGLFSLSHKRTMYRTTTEEPAALHMERRARVSHEAGVPVLESTVLWKTPRAASTEWNWITMSMAPRKAADETILSASNAGVKQPWWESKNSKIPMPTRSKSKGHLNKLAARSVPLRQQYRPSIAFRPDWDAALAEAMVLSYPKMRLRRYATESDWDSALNEALSQIEKHDVTRRHPVFAASNMTSSSEHFHPAATGYTYDPAVVNPIFFGPLTVTADQEVHPAMASYASRKLRRQRSRDRRQKEAQALPSLPSQPTEPISRLPVRSSSDAGPRARANTKSAGKRAQILAQIHALETEAHIPGMPVPEVPDFPDTPADEDMPRPQLARARTEPLSRPTSGLWEMPEQTVSPVGATAMWRPSRKTPVATPTTAGSVVSSVGEFEEAEDAGVRRRRKEGKRVEILARIQAIESGAEGGDFKGQGMWRMNQSVKEVKKDWLDDSVNKRFKGIQFRY